MAHIGAGVSFDPYKNMLSRPVVGVVSIRQLQVTALKALRTKMPSGFTGTVRFNLDPFTQHSEQAIWCELEKVQLKAYFEAGGETGLTKEQMHSCNKVIIVTGSLQLPRQITPK